jgi:hypothetical protein
MKQRKFWMNEKIIISFTICCGPGMPQTRPDALATESGGKFPILSPMEVNPIMAGPVIPGKRCNVKHCAHNPS